jgi:preprotein translocase subunit YajC
MPSTRPPHDTLKKMYDKFVKVFKDVKIGLTEFKRLRPFNVRAVKRSGCHCKVCEHYDGLRRGLQKAADMIEEWFDAAEESFNVSFSENKGTDDAIDTESASWREGTKWIIELADLQKKAEHMKLMLCPYLNGDPAMAADACVNGNCCKCGFKNKWKKLRAKLLQHGPRSFVNGGNEAGIQLQPGAPSVFMKLVELDIFESVPVDKEDSVSATIGAADDEEYGANSRKVRLENVRKQVSIIELLDMLDHSFVGMCQHRRTVARCKAAALQLHQNAIPGWVIINTDWAENWVVAPARMLQSQYWAQVSASIHVSMSQWLSSDHWHDRHVLKKGSRVTTADGNEWVVVSQVAEDVSIVSPDEANVESPTTTKIKRSELQTKLNAGDEVTTSTGSYGRVRSQEGSVVQVEIDGDVRQCARNTIHLRHWVTKAFFGLTNDRKQYARAKRTCLHVS